MSRRIWKKTIFGECQSMKNSKRIATVGRGRHAKTRIIKSERALSYSEDVRIQVGFLREPLRGRLRFTATIYYRTERPDLDEAILLDLLQGRVYENDRQVRSKRIDHAIDRENPRAEVLVEELEDFPPPPRVRAMALTRSHRCSRMWA